VFNLELLTNSVILSASWISGNYLRVGCLDEDSLGTLPQGARSRLKVQRQGLSPAAAIARQALLLSLKKIQVIFGAWLRNVPFGKDASLILSAAKRSPVVKRSFYYRDVPLGNCPQTLKPLASLYLFVNS